MSDGSAASAVSQRFRAAIDRFVSEGLLVRPGEGRRTALLFAQLLLSSAVFTLGRTVRDTLFLSRFSIKALPWMFVLYGVASALTVAAYSRVADKLPRSKMIVSWCALGASTYLGVWIAVKTLRLPPVSLEDIQALVLREVRESLRLQSAWESVRATVSTPLLEEEMKFREVRSVRRMLRILELRFPPDTMKLVRDRIEDPARRATAIELLDSSIDPPLRPLVIPFFDDVAIKEKCDRLGVKDVPTLEEFSRAQCEHANPYVTTLWLDALDRAKHPLARSEAERARTSADPMVREAAERVLAEAKDRKTTTYSTIEKLLVLRTASIFERLRAEDLAPLARVAEVEEFAPDEVVFAEGDPGDALYVVAHGHVGISHDGKRLATLQPGDAFGEMAVLDEAPRSASATALEPTTLLRIGSDEFYEVLREQSEIAEGVIRILSRRLREANETRAQGERSSEVLPSRPPPK